MKGKKVGILGGTFNPIHQGHLILAETARNQFDLDEILFIPSGISYMKKEDSIPPGNIRAIMTSLAIEDNEKYSISMLEVERQGNTYTFETLEELTKKYPNTHFYFILGADSLFHIDQWKNPDRIFALCTILAAVREDKNQEEMIQKMEELAQRYGGKIQLLSSTNIDISSTRIRKMISKNESIRYLVPEKVRQYILEHKIY